MHLDHVCPCQGTSACQEDDVLSENVVGRMGFRSRKAMHASYDGLPHAGHVLASHHAARPTACWIKSRTRVRTGFAAAGGLAVTVPKRCICECVPLRFLS